MVTDLTPSLNYNTYHLPSVFRNSLHQGSCVHTHTFDKELDQGTHSRWCHLMAQAVIVLHCTAGSAKPSHKQICILRMRFSPLSRASDFFPCVVFFSHSLSKNITEFYCKIAKGKAPAESYAIVPKSATSGLKVCTSGTVRLVQR